MRRSIPAFTLIELLVVIAILAIVIAIAAPALSYARTTAGVSGSLANLRTHGLWIASYAADHRDELLNPFARRDPYQTVHKPGYSAPTPVPLMPDGFSPFYATLVGHDLVGEWNGYHPTFFSPLDAYVEKIQLSPDAIGYSRRHNVLSPASYYYSSTMYQMDARFRSESGATLRDVIQRREVGDIAYPSRKVVFHERADFAAGRLLEDQPLWHESEARPAALFADGHAGTISVAAIYAAIEQGDESLCPAFPINIRLAQVGDDARTPLNYVSNGLFWATRNGLQGRDVP